MTLFSLVLLRHLTEPTTVLQRDDVTTDKYIETGLRLLRFSHQQKMATLQTKANTRIRRRAVHYEYRHHKNEQFEPNFVPNRSVLVNRPLLSGSWNPGDGMATTGYYKLQPRKPGAIRIIKVRTHTAVIDKKIHS